MDRRIPKRLVHTIDQYARRLILSAPQRTDPDSDEVRLRLRRKRDAEKNNRTTPSDEEIIDLCCIWAVELFTPSHMISLLKGLEQFGWNQNGLRNQRDMEEWIYESGKLLPGARGSWLDLDSVTASGINDMAHSRIHADALPPQHVTRIEGHLLSVTSSINCVVMMFVLDEDYAKRLDSALRRKRETVADPSARFRTIIEPEMQKRDDIRQIKGLLEWLQTVL